VSLFLNLIGTKVRFSIHLNNCFIYYFIFFPSFFEKSADFTRKMGCFGGKMGKEGTFHRLFVGGKRKKM
jgi:hypothetical protein